MVTPAGQAWKQLMAHDAARLEVGAQERHRMRLQRQVQMAIVLDHLLARRHRRQMHVGLHLRHRRAREQRQIVLVAGAAQSFHRPQCVTAAQAQRIEGVGMGEFCNALGGRPVRSQRSRTGRSRPRQLRSSCPSPRKSRRSGESRGDCVTRQDVSAHFGVSRMQIALWRGLASSVQSQFEQFTSTDRTSIPCSCASRTSWAVA